MTITGDLKHFQYFNFETSFLKNENEYRSLVESTKNENATFPYKTVLAEANAKSNRMGSTKWTYHKELSFASNYFFFKKNCFSLRTSYKNLI